MEIQLPDIPGISSRPLSRAGDYQIVADLVVAEARADGQDDSFMTSDDIEVAFRNTENMDLVHDFRFVEINGDPVGYVTTRWWDETDGPRIYRHMCKVIPEARNQGIGTAMLRWAQDRLFERAAGHKTDRRRVFRTDVDNASVGGAALIEANGYSAIQHGATLVRPNLDDIPEGPLPTGLEIRPVTEDQLRTIWEADIEAFRDHWGFSEPTEKDWQAFLDFPQRDESLWKVAWEGDRVAGQVRSFISDFENRENNRQRGWTEFISTAREWRAKGLATALICESLRELKRRGMEEAALGVHVENPHGAYRLYQSLGFEVISFGTTYEKVMGDGK
ncbi:MAG: GNAT family N-acetyltransferase [Acidimicrobiia bacterium]|nr:GNAT family N-acetyltransferase [Acidimicrobiia bacterium]